MRDLDQLKGRLMHVLLEVLVALPIAVGLLHHDAALQEQALQHPRHLKLVILRLPHADCQVLKITKNSHRVRAVRCSSHAFDTQWGCTDCNRWQSRIFLRASEGRFETRMLSTPIIDSMLRWVASLTMMPAGATIRCYPNSSGSSVLSSQGMNACKSCVKNA
jgi:hypothetical protein